MPKDIVETVECVQARLQSYAIHPDSGSQYSDSPLSDVARKLDVAFEPGHNLTFNTVERVLFQNKYFTDLYNEYAEIFKQYKLDNLFNDEFLKELIKLSANLEAEFKDGKRENLVQLIAARNLREHYIFWTDNLVNQLSQGELGKLFARFPERASEVNAEVKLLLASDKLKDPTQCQPSVAKVGMYGQTPRFSDDTPMFYPQKNRP